MNEQIGQVTAAEAVKSISKQLEGYDIPEEAMEIIRIGIQTAVTIGVTAAETVHKCTR